MTSPVLRDELVRLLQTYAAEADRLGQVFAERNGMHPTDLAALLAVMQADRAGSPLSPGSLGEHLGLSSGATTAVLDRLERAEHVRRARDKRDRRRITLHFGAAASAVGREFFGPLGAKIDRMLTEFDGSDLAVVRRFLERTNTLMREHRADLGADVGADARAAAGAQLTAEGAGRAYAGPH